MLQKINKRRLLFILLSVLPSLNVLAADNNDAKAAAYMTGGSLLGASMGVGSAIIGLSFPPVLVLSALVGITVGAVADADLKRLPKVNEEDQPARTPEEQAMREKLRLARAEIELEKTRTKLAQRQTKSLVAENELEENRIRLEQNRRLSAQIESQKALEACFIKNRNHPEMGPSGRPTVCEEAALVLGLAAGTREPVDNITTLFNDLRVK